jgi:Protein of unknown function (DUF2829)
MSKIKRPGREHIPDSYENDLRDSRAARAARELVYARGFDFPEALVYMRDKGAKCRRQAWAEGAFVFGGRVTMLEAPGVQLPLVVQTAPCFFYFDGESVIVPGWTPSSVDLLAQDWVRGQEGDHDHG